MPRRSDKVKTGVNSEIRLLASLRLLLLAHVRFVLIIQEINDR